MAAGSDRLAVVRSFSDLAADVMAGPPRLGPVRLVAVDGGAGSGKTTFAGRLGAALGAQVIHTDDLLDGWTHPTGYWPRLQEWVLEPLRDGRPGRYRRYDWERGEFAEWHDVVAAEVLVIEGVSSAQAQIRAELTRSVWVAAAEDVRLERGIARDGESMRPHWLRWLADEQVHFAADRTPEYVDVVVDGQPLVPHDPATQFVQLR